MSICRAPSASALIAIRLNTCDLRAHRARCSSRTTRVKRPPGQIVVAAVLARVLSPLQSLADRLALRAQRSDIDPHRIANALAQDAPAYAAYILLNVGILLAAFYFMRRICTPWYDAGAAAAVLLVAIAFLLASNDIVKAFVWSPHNQMFNVLVPVLTLYLALRAGTGALLRRGFAISAGLVTGLGSTAYPVFAIIVPCVAICALVFALRDKKRATWSRSLVNLVILTMLALMPEALWFAFVYLKIGGFYNHEIAHDREAVWMLDVWRQNPGLLVPLWLDKAKRLLVLAAPQAVPLAVVMLAVVAVALTNRSGRTPVAPPLLPLVATALLVSGVILVFYASIGFMQPRLAYPLIPPLIVAAAATALAVTRDNGRRRTFLASGCVAIALAAAVFTVVKNGPWG